MGYTHFFYKQRFCFNSTSVLVNFLMNLTSNIVYALLNTNKHNILRHFLCLVYLFQCLDLGLFMSYLCDLFFIIVFFFILINHIFSLKQTHLIFCTFFRTCPTFFGWSHGWSKRIILTKQKLSLRLLLNPLSANFTKWSNRSKR